MFDFVRLVDQNITDPHITIINKEFKSSLINSSNKKYNYI